MTAEPLLSDRTRRREIILAAALELFAVRGFDGTSLEEIGAAAGVTGPAIYRHFSNKQHILDEIVAASERLAAANVKMVVERETSARQKLVALVEHLVDWVGDEPDLVTVVLHDRDRLSDKARREFARVQHEYTDSVVEVIQQERPTIDVEEARVMVRLALGTAVSARVFVGPLDHSRRVMDGAAGSCLLAMLRIINIRECAAVRRFVRGLSTATEGLIGGHGATVGDTGKSSHLSARRRGGVTGWR